MTEVPAVRKGFSPQGQDEARETGTLSQTALVPAHLPQHVILLHIIDLARADFSFQSVFKELPTDIH